VDVLEFGALIGQTTESIIHANYDPYYITNDIALVKVSICYTGKSCFTECNTILSANFLLL
jgi:hypothetical protein